MEPIELSLFASRLQAICEEMGTALRRTAFSPNIRDRLDFSCAVFDTKGRLSAQAAHIPVHLGSMAFAMSGIVEGLRPAPGDMVILNDPYLAGRTSRTSPSSHRSSMGPSTAASWSIAPITRTSAARPRAACRSRPGSRTRDLSSPPSG